MNITIMFQYYESCNQKYFRLLKLNCDSINIDNITQGFLFCFLLIESHHRLLSSKSSRVGMIIYCLMVITLRGLQIRVKEKT